MSFTVFSYNAAVLLIQPNPSRVLENATQPNPWMDPTHVHLRVNSHHASTVVGVVDKLDRRRVSLTTTLKSDKSMAA